MKRFILVVLFLFSIIFCISSVYSFECGSTPNNNCDITNNTIFNPGDYFLPSGITIYGNDTVVNCNGARLIGTFDFTQNVGPMFTLEGSRIKIINCIMLNISDAGIDVQKGNGHIIENNKMINNYQRSTDAAIKNVQSQNLIIKNNIIDNFENGIVGEFKDIEIIHNEIKNVMIALFEFSGSLIPQYAIIKYNTIQADYESISGIFQNTIFESNIFESDYRTFQFHYSSNNKFIKNTINNTTEAFELGPNSENNIINQNIIINSGFPLISTLGINNFDGNYWQFYDELLEGCDDNDNNFICDNSLELNPINKDNCPQISPNIWIDCQEKTIGSNVPEFSLFSLVMLVSLIFIFAYKTRS
jgi:hypothetical protein